jgi:Mg-chelatase subunit ChlD
MDESERLRRWRLILGSDGPGLPGLAGVDADMDRSLSELYDADRSGSLSGSAPQVARWLGDIRAYFPSSVVRVMQKDALDRLGLKQMLLQPEMLEIVEADIHLVSTLLTLSRVIPVETKETAREVVRKLVDDLQRRLASHLIQAVRGALSRSSTSRNPRLTEVNWDRTIRANLKHYLPEQRTILPVRMVGYGRRAPALRDVVLCVDQSGSMAPSVVYASVFAAVLASIRALSTRMLVFDTAVADLSESLQDPVDVLFGARLGGGTDINRALAYCQQVITRPAQTVLVLISDLFEGGNAREMLERAAMLAQSGVQMVCLLALSDTGTPAYHADHASALASLGIPTFACTPDLFPELMAAALKRQDLALWAARHDIAVARPER